MQISYMQIVFLHVVPALLMGLSSVVNFTNMLFYPLTAFQKFLIFLYGFFIIFINSFILKPISFIIAAFLILFGTLLLIAVFQRYKILNLLCAIFNLYITIGTNYILISLLSCFGVDELFFREYPYMFCLYLIVQLICSYFISYLLYGLTYRNYFENKTTGLKISLARKIFVFLFCEIGICCFTLFLQIIRDSYVGISDMVKYHVFICLILFITINGITILFLKSILKEQHLSNQLAEANALKNYTEHLESLYLDIRSFKHDYINILSSLHCYINERDYEGLEQFFCQKILPAGSEMASDDSIYGRLGHIQEPKVKSILYSKIFLALKQKINVVTEINKKIDNFPMDKVDLVRILGNLLDNAIEASAATIEKKLSISFTKDFEGIYIQIQNSSCKIDNIEKLYQISISSKGGEHGIGLYEIRKILENYPNILLSTEYSNHLFSQKLALLYIKT